MAVILVTVISCIEKGVDFVGYHLLFVVRKTIEQFIARAIRLFEQELREALTSARLGVYVRRWGRCAGAGLGAVRGGNPNNPSILSFTHAYQSSSW